MAYSQNNVLIIPNVGVSTDVPQIIFTSSNLTSPGTITLRAYPNNNGTLSFEGSSGQLFSINNSLVGTLFSVNDISGIPSITVADSGLVQLSPYTGYVTIGGNVASTGTASGALQVQGGVGIGGAVYIGQTSYINNSQILTSSTFGQFITSGVSSVNAGTDTAVTQTTGSVTVYGTGTLQSITGRGSSTNYAITLQNATSATSTSTGSLVVYGGVGVGGSVYVGNRVGFVNTSNVSAVYQVYNSVVGSFDTVFG